MPHKTIVPYLLADTTLAAKVGTRIRPIIAKQSDSKPYLLYSRTGTEVQQHSTGTDTGSMVATFAWAAVAETYDDAWEVANAAFVRLAGYADKMATVPIWLVQVSGLADDVPEEISGEDAYIYVVTFTASVQFQFS